MGVYRRKDIIMNQYHQTTKKLCDFITASPSCYHVIENVRQMLENAGFLPLSENSSFELVPGGSYFVIRNGSALAAFRLPKKPVYNYQIIVSHCDSPAFKIKENPEIIKAGAYVELNVEKYGGPLFAPWFDRPLGVAGRLILEEDDSLKTVLVDSERPLAMIPSLAIHMDRNVNESASYKVQSDLLPLYGSLSSAGSFNALMAKAAGAEPEQVMGSDLFLYDRSAPAVWGADREFFSCPKLDDLQNVYSSIMALTEESSEDFGSVKVCCIFNNEEVGSRTRQGADSSFLTDILSRIHRQLSPSEEQQVLLSRSFMISADNGHAIHPNHLEKADPVNHPVLNGGVLIKHSAAQKYTTDAISAAIFRSICKKAGVPTQEFTNHSDIPGGSTLGNISASHLSIASVDIGCPQLAMHGPYETSGTKDTWYMIQAMKAFYQTQIHRESDTSYTLK